MTMYLTPEQRAEQYALLIRHSGVKQGHIADLLNVSREVISRRLNGHNVTMEALRALRDALAEIRNPPKDEWA